MPTNASNSFYQDLPTFQRHLSALLDSDDHFQPVPADWHVIVTDVKNSTVAVSKGQHEDVNLVATGSIIAVLNIAYQHNTVIPFFFGGDGATLIVPHSLLDEAMACLLQHQENSRRNFALELRVGQVKVAELYQSQHQIAIAKWEVDTAFAIPIVLGGGLAQAEKMIKADSYESQHNLGTHTLDLTGMECRWNKIKPPQDIREVVCLLVAFTSENHNRTVAKQVMDAIEEIYGNRADRNPISVKRLQLDTSIAKINREVSVKFGQPNWLTLIKTTIITLFAQVFYFKANQEGKHYLNRLVELSDTLVIDGRISTIISGTSAQREALAEQLDKLEQAGQIIYGLHVTQESIMSCYVRDRENQHIHFVDGADGGYTRAAVQLKQKLA